jgi:pSer/pThr/pTyr-binding forkhead associated (FHA) protein
MLIVEITRGLAQGETHSFPGELVRVGRAPSNDLVLADTHVSGEHAKLVVSPERTVLCDLRSTNGTTVVRGELRLRLGAEQAGIDLESGDVVELGTGDEVTAFRVTFEAPEEDATVVQLRELSDAGPAAAKLERDPSALSKLYAAQKRIGQVAELDEVLIAVADAVLGLVPNATHATVVLRDDDSEGSASAAAVFVPVMTRVRLHRGARAAHERAAVLAADAPERGRRDRVDHGRLDPQHHRRAALEGRGDPRRAAGRQPRAARDVQRPRPRAAAVLAPAGEPGGRTTRGSTGR